MRYRTKRILSVFLITVLCLSALTCITSAKDVNTLEVFTDLSKKDWYVKNGAIDFAYNNELFKGTSKTTFGPNENMTRGMFVSVLGRLHGVSDKNKETKFTDVDKNTYYSGFVKWASDNGIVSGASATQFLPDANVTREQICAMMLRYCNFSEISLKKINKAVSFSDAGDISNYAKKAVSACQQGAIVNGKGNNKFDPQGNATRAEVATILMNFCNNYKNESSTTPDNPDTPDDPDSSDDDFDMEIGVGPGTLPDENEDW